MTSIIQPPHYELISYTDDGVVIADRATDEQRKEIEEFFKELDGFSMDRTKTKKKSAPKKKKEASEEANSDS
tara:strand:+ start:1988 stop:2203 length:216 start_codon:yes stop_codon:yes gene_type:complete